MKPYTVLQKEIEEAPMTWLPALLLTVVKACLKRNVFRDADSLRRTVDKFIRDNQ